MRKNFILVITLAVLLFPVMSAPADGAGTITGRMLMKGGTPISGGIVIFFDLQGESPPAPESYVRPPDYVADLKMMAVSVWECRRVNIISAPLNGWMDSQNRPGKGMCFLW